VAAGWLSRRPRPAGSAPPAPGDGDGQCWCEYGERTRTRSARPVDLVRVRYSQGRRYGGFAPIHGDV